MSTALIWKRRDGGVFTARKLTAVRGQYVIVPSRLLDDWGVWHRRRMSVNGEIKSRFLDHAATVDEAKALAQSDADQRAVAR
jgi:hypothetical protein